MAPPARQGRKRFGMQDGPLSPRPPRPVPELRKDVGSKGKGARMSDPNEKRTRSFQCRDGLWEALEQMAGDLECSVDYLINEAVKQYLRQRGGRPSAGPRAPNDPLAAEPPPPPSPAAPPPYGAPLGTPPPPPPGMRAPRRPPMAP